MPMLVISPQEVYDGLGLENPWWETNRPLERISAFPERAYLESFRKLVLQAEPRRSVVLLGPRRVGKTVMIHQVIAALLRQGVSGTDIVYASIDRPLYNGQTLETFVRHHLERTPARRERRNLWFFFDEVQYMREWERELKSLTDLYPTIKFVASGSAAAALRQKSRESGAGRFTDFILPPLTFDEFIAFQGDRNASLEKLLAFAQSGFKEPDRLAELDIAFLNILFERYLTFGGYPEAVISSGVQRNLDRFVREDIVDKVLLRDLPSLYGISDTRELNSLFATLCYNTGQEVSLEGLSQSSAVAKNTLKRYLEYLEAAFLIRSLTRVDHNARRFQRQTTFKTYLANPSLRAALFKPIGQDDDLFGHLAETGVLSQWMHGRDLDGLHYTRWTGGEVDLVYLAPERQKPDWFVEVKWSDRFLNGFHEMKALRAFIEEHRETLTKGVVTTRTKFAARRHAGVEIEFVPTAVYAWMVGRNTAKANADDQLELSLTP